MTVSRFLYVVKVALRLETPREKKFRVWKSQYLRPGIYINLAYFVQVLGEGENEMARDWMKRSQSRQQTGGQQ